MDRTPDARPPADLHAAPKTGPHADPNTGPHAAVALGLFAAWLLHDLEELATVPRWTRTRVPELRRRFAQAAVARGYTPGSATSPLLVVPFTLWARGRLRRAGVLRPTTARDAALSLGLAGVAAVGAHAAARKVLAGRRRG
ncbi:HXXEE domain-containing protein [Streptomyces sp. B-S-A8]|uniref:HXXEE domain-containing protein n=1 Tax=Streptomyces solicavernae TaxID=3043614 RepID=A0ABT6RSC4_9ACTN|nr:HXXEE domain-containing protein [Streptomyces sp. B-S-A8]MDI3387344.1 HXXEE domain-containing protein [Streptomyces sp. B-S-A8]